MPRETPARRRGLLTLVIALLVAGAAVAYAQEPVLLIGGDGDDRLVGTAGSDSIYGRGGNDSLVGNAGDDELDGGPGADLFSGGAGRDAVSYSGAVGVSVTIDGRNDDGAPGEGDNVGRDVEDVFGGDGPDKLTGSAAANTIDGGAGNDILDGGRGADALFGGDGDDNIRSRDGAADHVDCGGGADDSVDADRIDVVRNCERGLPRTRLFRLARIRTNGRRATSLLLTGIDNPSTVVVACIRGCRPATRRSSVIRRRLVRSVRTAARIPLPRRPAIGRGAIFEVGVRGRGTSAGRCLRYRLGRAQPLRSRCTSAARRL